MKYVIIDATKTDLFTTECETKEEALKKAEKQFNYLTDFDKKKRTEFYILESIDSDEESEKHLDGDIIKRYI